MMYRKDNTNPRLSFVLCLVSILGFNHFASAQPVPVSPGGQDSLRIGQRCPTFNWGAVPNAGEYELVVYELDDQLSDEPVLRETIDGSATGWTPPLERCLRRGGRHAWSVRALGEDVASRWSSPSLFEISAGPSAVELEQALQVIELFLHGEASDQAPDERVPRLARARRSGLAKGLPTPQLEVDGIVLATSFDGDGSALTALSPANLSGPVDVAQGGTGASEAAGALTNLGAAAAAHSHTVSDISDLVPYDAPLGQIIAVSPLVSPPDINLWARCDGSPVPTDSAIKAFMNNTPDLSDARFLMGAAPGPEETGGTNSNSHTHIAVGHHHGRGSLSASTSSSGNHRHDLPADEQSSFAGDIQSLSHTFGNDEGLSNATPTGYGGIHTHVISLSGSIGNWNGPNGDGDRQTSEASNTENRPNYYKVVYYIKVN